jgi:hypothetical protein
MNSRRACDLDQQHLDVGLDAGEAGFDLGLQGGHGGHGLLRHF